MKSANEATKNVLLSLANLQTSGGSGHEKKRTPFDFGSGHANPRAALDPDKTLVCRCMFSYRFVNSLQYFSQIKLLLA